MAGLACYNREEIHPTEYEKCFVGLSTTSALEIAEYADL